jgi:hypothetical protein
MVNKNNIASMESSCKEQRQIANKTNEVYHNINKNKNTRNNQLCNVVKVINIRAVVSETLYFGAD